MREGKLIPEQTGCKYRCVGGLFFSLMELSFLSQIGLYRI